MKKCFLCSEVTKSYAVSDSNDIMCYDCICAHYYAFTDEEFKKLEKECFENQED